MTREEIAKELRVSGKKLARCPDCGSVVAGEAQLKAADLVDAGEYVQAAALLADDWVIGGRLIANVQHLVSEQMKEAQQ